MRSAAMILVVILFTCVFSVNAGEAQEEVQSHIRHVMESSSETPREMGLLTVALSEVAIAREHAGYAAGGAEDPGDLNSMQTHSAHVLHAVDPSRIDEGPGLGVGVKRATERIIYHIESAAASADATESVRTHAEHVATAARNAIVFVERIIALVGQIRATESAEEVAPLTDELEALSRQLSTGVDANGDGRVTWRGGEGGLEHVKQHMELMVAGEGS